MSHPNALTAGTAASIGVLAVWIAGHFGIKLGAEEAAAIAGAASAVALFIGRNGLIGLARILWRGRNT